MLLRNLEEMFNRPKIELTNERLQCHIGVYVKDHASHFIKRIVKPKESYRLNVSIMWTNHSLAWADRCVPFCTVKRWAHWAVWLSNQLISVRLQRQEISVELRRLRPPNNLVVVTMDLTLICFEWANTNCTKIKWGLRRSKETDAISNEATWWVECAVRDQLDCFFPPAKGGRSFWSIRINYHSYKSMQSNTLMRFKFLFRLVQFYFAAAPNKTQQMHPVNSCPQLILNSIANKFSVDFL